MSSLVGGIGIIGQDLVCGFSNGKYKTFEGTEISIENCVKAKVKDLVVEGKTIQDTENLSNIESVTEREKNLVNTTTIYESMLESGTIGSLFNPKSNSAYDVYKMEIQPNTEYLFNLVGYGQTPWVRILDKNNNELFVKQGLKIDCTYESEYSAGDKIYISANNCYFFKIQLDSALKETVVYAPSGSFEYRIPTEVLERLYEEGAFNSKYNNYNGEVDYNFMLKMFNKRNKDDITVAQRKKIAAILLNSIKPFLQDVLACKVR